MPICKTYFAWDYSLKTYEGSYCETQFWMEVYGDKDGNARDYTEPFNGISSLLFCLTSISLIWQFKKINSIGKLTLASMFNVGISSGSFHFFKTHFANQLDVKSMLVSIYLGWFFVIDTILYSYTVVKWKSPKLYKYIGYVWAIIILFGLIAVESLKVSGDLGTSFDSNYYFIIPNLGVLFGLLWMVFFSHSEHFKTPKLKFLVFWNILLYVTAVLIRLEWAEPICRNNFNLQLFQPHALWHITISWAYYNTLFLIFFMYSEDKEMNPITEDYLCECSICCINGCWGTFNHLLSYIIPSVTIYKGDYKTNILPLYQKTILS
jgi:hypothetical protein